MRQSVRDWDSFLKPSLVHPPPVGIQHRLFDGNVTKVCHTFRIQKNALGFVALHYKEFCADTKWLPAIDPMADTVETCPNGIEIFKEFWPPPDPMVTPPVEVQF